MKRILLALAVLATPLTASATTPQMEPPKAFIEMGFTNLQPVLTADGKVAYWTGQQPDSYGNSNENPVSMFNLRGWLEEAKGVNGE